ncbi:MAG: hypothetical protein QGG40_22320, partial [Myxococcota bacterium]|nr:hypothetical protein [Myxococcota bacterium]
MLRVLVAVGMSSLTMWGAGEFRLRGNGIGNGELTQSLSDQTSGTAGGDRQGNPRSRAPSGSTPLVSPCTTWGSATGPCSPVEGQSGQPAASQEDCAPPDPIHVLQGAEDGDGSQAFPYGTLGEALDHARTEEACRVDILAGQGWYDEPLNLDRPTSIYGLSTVHTFVVGPIVHGEAAPL